MGHQEFDLDKTQVRTPCPVSWDEMVGNGRLRHCAHCNKNVHNFSHMTSREIQSALNQSKGKLCATFQKRPDGTLVTADEPSSLRLISGRVSRLTAGAFSLALGLFSSMGTLQTQAASRPTAQTQSPEQKKAATDSPPTSPTGIKGCVLDLSGAAIPNASVTATSDATKVPKEVSTNSKGEFLILLDQPGKYSLKIIAEGFFQNQIFEIDVRNGQLQTLEPSILGYFTTGIVDLPVPRKHGFQRVREVFLLPFKGLKRLFS